MMPERSMGAQPEKTVSDIMVREVVSVHPDTLLIEAAKILGGHNFDGVPVVDYQNTLLGILTEYDLISKGSAVHLPTFQKVLQNLSLQDGENLKNEIKQIASLKVQDVMNSEPLTLLSSATLSEAVALFRDHHRVNPVPVIDANKKVVGVVSRYDIIKLFHLVYQ